MPAGIDPRQQRSNAVEGGKTSAKPRAHYIWRPRAAYCHVIMSRDAHTAKSRDGHFAVIPSPSFSFIMQAQAAKPQEVHKY